MIKNDIVIKDEILTHILNDLLLAMRFYSQERNIKLDDVQYEVLKCKNRILFGVILSSLENHTKVIMNFTNRNISDFVQEGIFTENDSVSTDFIFDVICEFFEFIKISAIHQINDRNEFKESVGLI